MAVQIEARGQIQDFLDVLRRRAWQIAVPAIFVITLGSCLAVIIPRKFLAKTQVEVRQSGPTLIGKEGQNATFQIRAPERIKSVVEEKLRPPVYQAMDETDRREFLKDVAKNLNVVPNVGGQQSSIFITITYTDVDRVFAGDLLRALRDDWQADVLDQDKNRLQEEKRRYGDEVANMQNRLEKEEDELSALRKDNGLSAMQPVPGTTTNQTEDPEYNRLQQHRGEIAQYELQLAGLQGQRKRLADQEKTTPERVPSEKLLKGSTHEKEIADVQAKIRAANEKLRDYKPLHSGYVLTRELIRSLEERLEELQGTVTGSSLSTVEVENPAWTELQSQIGKVEADIADLQAKRAGLQKMIVEEEHNVGSLHEVYKKVRLLEEQIHVHQESLKTAELAYQAKVREAAIASSPKNNPFAILEQVNVPLKATEPNPWLVVILSIAAGLGIGIGLAVVLEYTKSCFRSVYDVSRVLPVPILGNINKIVTKRESKQRLARRLVVGAASLLVLGSVAFVTWAWAHDQESGLLSPALRKAIEGLRAALK